MRNIMGAQKRNIFKKFHLLPAANEYLVFLITFIYTKQLTNVSVAVQRAIILPPVTLVL